MIFSFSLWIIEIHFILAFCIVTWWAMFWLLWTPGRQVWSMNCFCLRGLRCCKNTSGVSEVSGVSSISGISGISEVSVVSEVLDVSETPEMPQTSETTETPETCETSETPEMPVTTETTKKFLQHLRPMRQKQFVVHPALFLPECNLSSHKTGHGKLRNITDFFHHV